MVRNTCFYVEEISNIRLASILLTIEESKVFAYILDEDRVTRHLISLNEHPIQRVWGASFDTESDMSTWIIIGTTDTHHLMVVMIQYGKSTSFHIYR
jgi:hypothetical protein